MATSSITIPAVGAVDAEVITLATQVKADIEGLGAASPDVANVAALTALVTSGLSTGHERKVLTVLDFFELDKASTLTADGISVVLTDTGTGRWLRKAAGHLKWLNQSAAWRVNASTGNDENSGQSGSPLKTFAELQRRFGAGGLLNPGNGSSVVIGIETDLAATDPISLDIRLSKSVSLLIQGLNTTTLYTGSFSAVTAKNRATNTPLQGTDAGITGGAWTNFLPAGTTPGRVHDTTNDSYFWPAKDLGGGACRFSEPMKKFSTVVASNYPNMTTAQRPASAVTALDAFTIERLTKVFFGGFNIASADGTGTALGSINACNLAFQDLDIEKDAGGNNSRLGITVSGYVPVIYYETMVAMQQTCNGNNGDIFLQNSCHRRNMFAFGAWHINAGLVTATFNTGGQVVVPDFDAMFQGGAAGAGALGLLGCLGSIGTCCVFDATTGGGAPTANPTGDGVHVTVGSTVRLITLVDSTHALWGSGNAGAGVGTSPGGVFLYQTNAPTITGTAGDFTLAGATSSRAWDETANAGAGGYSATLISNTWANLVLAIAGGGLGESATNVGKHAMIAKGT